MTSTARYFTPPLVDPDPLMSEQVATEQLNTRMFSTEISDRRAMWADVLSREEVGQLAERPALAVVGAGIDQVAGQLAAEFDGAVDAVIVERVVHAARRDLEGDVPEGALPELVHRLAKQRLLDPDNGDVGSSRRSGRFERQKGT